jgi:serine/threonine protein kinase
MAEDRRDNDLGISGEASAPSDSRSPAPAVKTFPPLGRVGRYVLERPLGRGGMAEVFLARHDGPSSFRKYVVLKRVHRALLGDERYVQMFLREARIAARLNHTNLVQVFELGEDNEDYYLAMEHIEGLTLQKAARRVWAAGSSVPMEVALRAVADAARGLHYAHTLRDEDGNDVSLVHRDISPDNLMLTRDGVTKVLDFGIAKGQDDVSITTDGDLKGKIPFLSPEQIAGEPLDGRSDLWALGVTLYWLLTGKRPFHAATDILTLQAIAQQQPVPPRELNPLVPPALQALVLELLHKDRHQRVPHGNELSHRLLTLLGPAAAGPESADFARYALTLPDDVANSPRTLTMAASQPYSEWLKAPAHQVPGQVPSPSSLSSPSSPSSPSSLSSPSSPSSTRLPPSLPPAPAPRPRTNVDDDDDDDDDDFRASPWRAPLALLGAVVAAFALTGFALALMRTASTSSAVSSAVSSTSNATATGAVTSTAQSVGHTMGHSIGVAAVPTASTTATTGTMATSSSAPGAWRARLDGTFSEGPAAGAVTPGSSPATNQAPSSSAAATAVTARASSSNTNGSWVPVKAPAHVTWETEQGVRLVLSGKGLSLPPKTKRIIARDRQRGGRIVLDVGTGGTIDWDTLPRGRIDVRVEPYAEVLLGAEKLGTTPFTPVAVVAGSYTLVLTHEGQRVEKAVEVAAGRDTRVTHRF